MTDNWLGELESDSLFAGDGAESEDYLETIDGETDTGGYYGDDIDAAEGSARERARRRALRRARLRRQAEQARARRLQRPARPVPVSAAVRRTQADVSNLAVKSQVQADVIGDALAAQRASITGTQQAVGASLLVNQVLNTFGKSGILANDLVRMAAPLAPLLLMKPPRKPAGIAGMAGDPRVFAPVGVAALAVLQKLAQPKAAEVDRLLVTVTPSTLARGETALVDFRAVDRVGRTVTVEGITLRSRNERLVTVDQAKGEVTAAAHGTGRTAIVAEVTVEGRLVRGAAEVTVQ
ncbi:hypothetical protein ABZ801_35530 [Actinomadura sp. NPDC047616]|uniref:hypothetical protein n=1 Tax=Actinomadura sp. NPDC047616 TaxID=3155914 RepID=UPI0033C74128